MTKSHTHAFEHRSLMTGIPARHHRWIRTVLIVHAFIAGIATTAFAQSEGVKVHGRWVIEVQNPDGTRVSRDVFENALDGGQITLASLMGRLLTGLVWHVTIHGPASDHPCVFSASLTSPCAIAEPSHPGGSGGFLSKNLQVVVPRGANGIPLGTVEMRGSITAQRSTSITEVRSGIDAFVADGAGGTIALFQQVFTSKQLPAAEWKRVEAGQIVQVTVVFSFS